METQAEYIVETVPDVRTWHCYNCGTWLGTVTMNAMRLPELTVVLPPGNVVRTYTQVEILCPACGRMVEWHANGDSLRRLLARRRVAFGVV